MPVKEGRARRHPAGAGPHHIGQYQYRVYRVYRVYRGYRVFILKGIYVGVYREYIPL